MSDQESVNSSNGSTDTLINPVPSDNIDSEESQPHTDDSDPSHSSIPDPDGNDVMNTNVITTLTTTNFWAVMMFVFQQRAGPNPDPQQATTLGMQVGEKLLEFGCSGQEVKYEYPFDDAFFTALSNTLRNGMSNASESDLVEDE
ncbi:hypothetical protein M231_01725 [Tremella mesenterica]|uniref:Uncharacterized protein n=1 Tax=Tremella mesenterica TaxID=5217 RepID=A0A4V1M4M4_TREME|nr:hypothetical protein M231_01725 [Tremella mesenterica]